MPSKHLIPAGAQRVASFETVGPDGKSTYVALYQRASGDLAVLVDQFNDGDEARWDSMFLDFDVTDQLRRTLNRQFKEAR